MKIILGLIVVISIITIITILKSKKEKLTLKEKVKKIYPKHTIIEKFGTVMICEINHRNEPDELAFIRIGQKKKIEKTGRRIAIEYPSQPSINDLKKDLKKYI
ncbi:hypothetical protein [Acinetobacter seifertii]|uniref:hypothetical protein n=1 Tax=Acinetobacter seifertii TaxID=1530123 RepID=UPI001250B2B6|nr:hypothetical protein [Acinetobacter seifertii]